MPRPALQIVPLLGSARGAGPMVEGGSPMPAFVDCAVVGGGPAGLTAAIYLARYHLSVMVLDAGQSRAALIPLTRNHAGFPDGISGPSLLERMRAQAMRYGAVLRHALVEGAEIDAEGFLIRADRLAVRARSILFATGVVNRPPAMMDKQDHLRAVEAGRIRYCPVCDGYEVTDRRIAVLGTGEHGCNEAIFLRSYTRDITLIAPEGGHRLTEGQKQRLADAGIAVSGVCQSMQLKDDGIWVDDGERSHCFESIYPALGSDTRSKVAAALGVDVSSDGCVLVDDHQRTNVRGVYAAGDVVLGLDQISHAMGQGGVAATKIRNDLAEVRSLYR